MFREEDDYSLIIRILRIDAHAVAPTRGWVDDESRMTNLSPSAEESRSNEPSGKLGRGNLGEKNLLYVRSMFLGFAHVVNAAMGQKVLSSSL